MGVKTLIILVALVILISACSTEEKTIPVVTDITAEVVREVQEEGINDSEGEIKENETIEIEEITEEEINESEEEKEEETSPPILPPGTHVITIEDLKLNPRELTIKKGDTVIWNHKDKWEKDDETKHYLAAHTNEFRTPILYYGDTFEHTFNKTGTFTYIDVIYKERDFMRGKIIVE